MKKWIQLSILTGISIAFICILSVFSFIKYLESDHARNQLESIFNQHVPGIIHVNNISINLWKSEIEFNQILFQSSQNDPLTGCETLRLEFTLYQILSDPIKIKRFSLIQPWVFLPLNPDKPLNFKRLAPFFTFINQLIRKRIFSGNDKKATSSFIVDALHIDKGKLYFSKDVHQHTWCLENLNINAYEDRLDINGILNYLGEKFQPFQVFQLNTTCLYPQQTMAQQLIHLISSQSQDIFYDRIQQIQKQLRFQTKGNLRFENELFHQIKSLSNEITGDIKGKFDLNALSHDPTIHFSLDYSGGSIHNIPVDHILLRANASNHMITLNHLNAKTKAGNFDIQGLIDLKGLLNDSIFTNKKWDQLTYQFIIQSKQFALNHFYPIIGKDCKINGQLKLKGHGIDPESLVSDIIFESSATLPEINYIQSDSPITVQANAHIESGSLTLTSLIAQTEGFSLSSSGNMKMFPKPQAKVSIVSRLSANVLDLVDFPDLSGDLQTSLQINKTSDAINGDFHLNGHQLSLNGYQLGDLVADISIDKGNLTLHQARLSQSKSQIKTSGYAQWKDWRSCFKQLPDTYGLTIQSNEVNINLAHPALHGTIKFDGDIKAINDRLKGKIDINGSTLSVFGQKMLSLRLPVQLKEQQLCINQGEIEIVSDEIITLQGCLGENTQYSININGEKISLSHLKWQVPGLKGNLHINISGNGVLNQPQLNGDIVVKQLSFNDQLLPETIIQISSDQDIMVIKGESLLDFHGKYNIRKNIFQLSAQADKMKLAPIFMSAGLSKCDGLLSGIFKIGGNLNDINNAKTSLDIDHFRFIYQGIPVAWMKDFKLEIDQQKLTSTSSTIHLPNGGFCKSSFSGSFPANSKITVHSHIPLEALSTIVDNIGDIQGKLTIKGQLNHILQDPMFEGQVLIRDGEYVLPWNNQRYHHIQAAVNVSNHLFALQQLSFGVDEGKCDLKGKMILSKRKPTHINLFLSASALPLHIPDSADILLNASLNYEQKHQRSQLSGTVEFLETLYYHELSVNKMLLERIQKTRRPTIVDTLCKTVPKICGTSLDISIQARQPMITDNDLAYLEIQPDLNIRGTIYQPVVLGRAEIITGEINYLSKNFVLEKGLIDFINPYRMEPVIDIESNVQVKDWQINLDVLGKLDELQVKLSSTPSEEHADIISILLFGKPTDQLFTPDTGPYKSNQQMIAELLSSAFEKDIKQTTGLDTFKLEALEHETMEENQTDDYKVTLGKELSRRMAITYALETHNGQLIHHTVADYKILENLLLRGMQDTQGAYGGELLFRIEFRQLPGF